MGAIFYGGYKPFYGGDSAFYGVGAIFYGWKKSRNIFYTVCHIMINVYLIIRCECERKKGQTN